jgi:hypothetical protein
MSARPKANSSPGARRAPGMAWVLTLLIGAMLVTFVTAYIFVSVTGRSVLIGGQGTHIEIVKGSVLSPLYPSANPPVVIGDVIPFGQRSNYSCTGPHQPLGDITVFWFQCH